MDIVNFIFFSNYVSLFYLLILFIYLKFYLFIFVSLHRKLQPTPPKQLQNFSAEDVSSRKVEQEESAFSPVGQQ